MSKKMYGIIATYTDDALNRALKNAKEKQKERLMECCGEELYDLDLSKKLAERLRNEAFWCESARVVEIKELNND